jgi:hypothetical protein
LIINRIEIQFDVLDKDFISFLDRQFPSYKNYMDSLTIGPIFPKGLLFDKIYKGLVPSLLMQTIPSALTSDKFAWVTNCMQCSNDTLRLQNSNTLSTAAMEPAARKMVGRRGKKIIPPSFRFTRSTLKAQVSI